MLLKKFFQNIHQCFPKRLIPSQKLVLFNTAFPTLEI
jgi:hypothetical protein